MRTIMNLIWFVFGGLVMGLGWWLAGLIAMITIVGIPWARSCFVIGTFAFFPFGIQHLKLAGIALAPIGKTVVSRDVAEASRRFNADATLRRMRGVA